MAKRPASQFYWGDWRRDTALRACSLEARGLWIDLLCIMHDGEPYGHLAVNNIALTDEETAPMIGIPVSRYRKLLKELESKSVPSRTADGTIFSRRMVRDERIRAVRAEAGKAGGIASVLLKQNPSKAQASGQAKRKLIVADADADIGDRSGKGGRPDAWVDRFAVEWEALIGMASKPKLLLHLSPLVRDHGVPQVFAAWQGYLREGKGKPWVAVTHFANTYLAIRDRWSTTLDEAGQELRIPSEPGRLEVA